MCVVGLYVAPKAGAPMERRASIDVEPGAGAEGDRYREGTGHWSDPRWPDQELTLFEEETADALGLDAALLRRNVVTRGVHLAELVGRDLRLGPVFVHAVRHCDPCQYLEDLLGRPGLRAALEGRGGLRVAVVSAGRIAVGDEVSPSRPTPS